MWTWLLLGCDDTTFPALGGGATTVTGDTYDDVTTLFDGNCIACHSTASALGGLDLETDPCAAIVGVPAAGYDGDLVVPGDHAASVLWAKMANTSEYGGVMPPTGELPQASVDTVAAWIDAGASCGAATTGDTGGTP